MKHSLKAYLANDLFEGFFSSIQEENILDLLVKLKKKITELLNEEAFDEKKVDHYLKIVAMFEQLFRFLNAKKINPVEIVGLKSIVDKSDMETANENALEQGIGKILDSYDNHHMINFKKIVERRFTDFKKWFFGKNKEDLEIVQGAIDYTVQSIQKYHSDLRLV